MKKNKKILLILSCLFFSQLRLFASFVAHDVNVDKSKTDLEKKERTTESESVDQIAKVEEDANKKASLTERIIHDHDLVDIDGNRQDSLSLEDLPKQEEISNGKLVSTIKHPEDFTKVQYDYVQKWLENAMKERSSLDQENVKVDDKGNIQGKIFNALYRPDFSENESKFPDTNALNRRINNFDRTTRTTAVMMLSHLKEANTLDGHIKNTNTHEIAETMIKTQIDNAFGKTSSGQSVVQISDPTKEEIISDILEHHSNLFDASIRDSLGKQIRPKSDIERLNDITKVSDMIMNKFSQGTGSTFETAIDDQGRYTSKITDAKGLAFKSVIDRQGNRISRELTIDDKDAKGKKFSTVFDTATDPNTGEEQTFVTQGEYHIKLKPDKAKLAKELSNAYKTSIVAKTGIKAVLYTTKHTAVNVVAMAVPMSLSTIATVDVLATVKLANVLDEYSRHKANGDSNYDAAKKAIENPIVMGSIAAGCKAFGLDDAGRFALSGDKNRVFKQGSRMSKLLSGNYKEQADPAEEYLSVVNALIEELVNSMHSQELVSDQSLANHKKVMQNDAAAKKAHDQKNGVAPLADNFGLFVANQ